MKTSHSDQFEDVGNNEERTDTDEENDDEFERKERDMFENAGRKERSLISTWKESGIQKDKVLQTLITKFSMIVHKNDAAEIDVALYEQCNGASIADFCVDDLPPNALYSKLPTAVKALIKLIA